MCGVIFPKACIAHPINSIIWPSLQNCTQQILHSLHDTQLSSGPVTTQDNIARILNHLFQADSKSTDTTTHIKIRKEAELIKKPVALNNTVPFTQQEIDHIVSTAPSKKAPGLDGIDGYILKRLHKSSPTTLLQLFNASKTLGHFLNY
ncbi:hypothetical protein CEXT_770361 [Caerostris extrusa]|uniref:Reverse transcriptase n=1 Tax=Caerostris extrusa TaxID=172846 RepID=A0AAV4RBW0_CAEEX|nr:hypothetical protein CEXT_770361 [Caerostris extrusa]